MFVIKYLKIIIKTCIKLFNITKNIYVNLEEIK